MSKRIEPSAIPTDLELAWAAGVMDGEGCILVHAQSGRMGRHGVQGAPIHELRVVLVNTNKPMLDRFQSWFGGAITKKKKRGTERRNIAEWRISGQRAAGVLSQLLPYLLVKREEALLGLEFAKTLTPKNSYNAMSGMGAPKPPLEVIEWRQAIREELQRVKRVEHSFN